MTTSRGSYRCRISLYLVTSIINSQTAAAGIIRVVCGARTYRRVCWERGPPRPPPVHSFGIDDVSYNGGTGLSLYRAAESHSGTVGGSWDGSNLSSSMWLAIDTAAANVAVVNVAVVCKMQRQDRRCRGGEECWTQSGTVAAGIAKTNGIREMK